MRNQIVFNVYFTLICALLFFPLLTSAAPSCPYMTRTLTVGSRGEDVKQLQSYLAATGDLEARLVSGYYGLKTQDAVARWQCSHSLVCTGTPETSGLGQVGLKTRTVMSGECAIPGHTLGQVLGASTSRWDSIRASSTNSLPTVPFAVTPVSMQSVPKITIVPMPSFTMPPYVNVPVVVQ